MLKITFGRYRNEAWAIDYYFEDVYDSDCHWGDDEFIRRMILDIDECTHVADDMFKHQQWGLLRMVDLSGSVKNLILMYKQPTEIMYRATNCGEECASWIEQIASMHDIHVSLSYLMDLNPLNVKGGIYCTNEERYLKDIEDYMFTAVKYINKNLNFE